MFPKQKININSLDRCQQVRVEALLFLLKQERKLLQQILKIQQEAKLIGLRFGYDEIECPDGKIKIIEEEHAKLHLLKIVNDLSKYMPRKLVESIFKANKKICRIKKITYIPAEKTDNAKLGT